MNKYKFILGKSSAEGDVRIEGLRKGPLPVIDGKSEAGGETTIAAFPDSSFLFVESFVAATNWYNQKDRKKNIIKIINFI